MRVEGVKMTFFFKSKKENENHSFSKSDYLFEEKSFINYEDNDISLMINHQYLSLDVESEHNIITGISGYYNLSGALERSLDFLEGETGIIEVISDSVHLESGIGYSYPVRGESFFDSKKQILQIGKSICNTKNIKISKNIMISLFEKKITCIQIKI